MYDIVDRCDTNRDNHQTQHYQDAAGQKVRSLFYIHTGVLENGAGEGIRTLSDSLEGCVLSQENTRIKNSIVRQSI